MVIENSPLNLYNMLKKDSEAHDDVICSHNEAYNVIEEEDVTWDRSEFLNIDW